MRLRTHLSRLALAYAAQWNGLEIEVADYYTAEQLPPAFILARPELREQAADVEAMAAPRINTVALLILSSSQRWQRRSE